MDEAVDKQVCLFVWFVCLCRGKGEAVSMSREKQKGGGGVFVASFVSPSKPPFGLC